MFISFELRPLRLVQNQWHCDRFAMVDRNKIKVVHICIGINVCGAEMILYRTGSVA